MKIIIDTETCKKKGLDVDVALYLLSVLSGSTITVDTYEKARQEGYLNLAEPYSRDKPFPLHLSLSNTGEFVAEGIMAESNDDVADTLISVGRQIIEAINNTNTEIRIGDDVISAAAARGAKDYKKRTSKTHSFETNILDSASFGGSKK